MAESKTGLNPNFSLEKLIENDKQPQNDVMTAANKLEKLIYNDTLTGFKNRRGLNQYRNNLRTDQYPLKVLTVDLDNLKKINDNPDPNIGGHAGGDRYILSSVKFFNELFPDLEKYRLGGDEFAILVPESDSEKIDLIYQKLEEFNEKEQNQNKLELTYATDTVLSKEDFYAALKRSDDKLVEAKKIKKNK